MDAIINRKCQEFEAQGQCINVLWNACKKCNSSRKTPSFPRDGVEDEKEWTMKSK